MFETAALKGMHAACLPHPAQCESVEPPTWTREAASVEASVRVTATSALDPSVGRRLWHGCRGESEEQQPKGGGGWGRRVVMGYIRHTARIKAKWGEREEEVKMEGGKMCLGLDTEGGSEGVGGGGGEMMRGRLKREWSEI